MNFAILEFTCVNCHEKKELDVMENCKDKYSYKCECGQKYFVNREKSKVIKMGDTKNENTNTNI